MKKRPGLTIHQFDDQQHWLLNMVEQQKSIITQLKAQVKSLTLENQQLKVELTHYQNQLMLAEEAIHAFKAARQHKKGYKILERLEQELAIHRKQLDFKFDA